MIVGAAGGAAGGVGWRCRLEGFEPPTLGSVDTFHSQQLGDLRENIA
jgi:hypothetical protein